MSKTFKTLWNILTTLIVAAVVVLAILLAGVRLFGLQVFTVLSGSMEPVYHTGSLIYVKTIEDTRNIPDGTVITYMVSEDTIVTHRTVAPVPDEDDPSVIRYRTKGDANDVEDGTLVHYKNIIGTPVFTIPKLGYVANYIQNPPGSYMTICFGAIFILLLFLPELLAVFLEKEEEEDEAPTEKKSVSRKKAKAERTRKRPKEMPAEERSRDGRQSGCKEHPSPASLRTEPEYYDGAEPPEYEEAEAYREPFDYAGSEATQSEAADDWLAALLADVDLEDTGWQEERPAADCSRDKKRRGGSHSAV